MIEMAKERKINQYYQIKEGKVERVLNACPKCGPGTYLAAHSNRLACGRCGYTEWKKQ